MSREPMEVIVIGAGTGGLCLAHGLKRAGINVNVYERDRTRADGLQGYRVGINPHGLASLEACLPPELYATFLATCARFPGLSGCALVPAAALARRCVPSTRYPRRRTRTGIGPAR